MQKDPIQEVFADDGKPLSVTTTDADPNFLARFAEEEARLEALLAEFRDRGHPRPVLIVFQRDCPIEDRTALKAHLPATAREMRYAAAEGVEAFMVSTHDARTLLRDRYGKKSADLFRQHEHPNSYFTVNISRRGTDILESKSRSYRADAAERPHEILAKSEGDRMGEAKVEVMIVGGQGVDENKPETGQRS